MMTRIDSKAHIWSLMRIRGMNVCKPHGILGWALFLLALPACVLVEDGSGEHVDAPVPDGATGAPLADAYTPAVADGAPDRAWLDAGAHRDAAIAQYAQLKASNPEAGDRFGWSVALAGDTLAVGASHEDSRAPSAGGHQHDNGASGSGAVYVFRRHGDTWVQEAYLKASNAEVGDRFGWSVALAGDTLAVGAVWEDSSATGVNGQQRNNRAPDSGAVYVFRRHRGTWIQEAYLKASNTGIGDYFGHSVALAGDTLAVGAYREDSSARGIDGRQDDDDAPDSGAVYVFRRHGNTWAQEAYLKASNTGALDELGRSVALAGDTLAAGAYYEDSRATGVNGDQEDDGAPGSGAVYVFRRQGGTWAQEAYLKASNTGAGDWFGRSVALAGHTLVAGAIMEDSSATGAGGDQHDDSAPQSGAVYVFRRQGGTWMQDAYLKASNTGADDRFGISVALAGDTLAVGAIFEASSATGVGGYQHDDSAPQSGAVYLFSRTGSSWTQEAYIKGSNTEEGDELGFCLALSESALVVGAVFEDSSFTEDRGLQVPWDDDSAADSGAVYVFQ